MQQSFIRAYEAAEILGVSRQCIYQHISTGKLTKYVDRKRRRDVYVDYGEVMELQQPQIIRADEKSPRA
ncbi:hypothetical protein Selin_0043 [Desulfurispirillum indicum S5]|uniref:Helix-turn-helix domain-containing protein n=1 Tax=Desulfurispirillum indicum (strain ATCC BAA-1389 / DSM 22839 / S5) TaxID=653733 RepID=E6W4S4_DESIS|nr:helix-turn-helix domain-containing protein [Desulfurispirillum indicum]ADU64802.1 hypothetical protein Selin_0043 [Desulfurispirillum indicum S5]